MRDNRVSEKLKDRERKMYSRIERFIQEKNSTYMGEVICGTARFIHKKDIGPGEIYGRYTVKIATV